MIRESKVSCLLLAAGSSSRMGFDKLSLPLGSGDSMLEQTARSLADSPLLQRILVVRDRKRLVFLPERYGYEVLEIGEEAGRGLHRSLKRGLSHLGASAEAVLLAMGDQPFLRSHDYTAMLAAYAEGLGRGLDLLRPVGAEDPARHGNPVVIHRRYFPEILREPDRDQDCHYLFERHPGQTNAWPVSASAYFQGLDTPEDYRRCLN